MPQDSSSNDLLWAFDDSNSDTPTLLAEPSYDETYDAFLDPIEPNSDLSVSGNDWASIFYDPSEEADYSTQEQPPGNDDDFLSATGPNSYLNAPSSELTSIFNDPS